MKYYLIILLLITFLSTEFARGGGCNFHLAVTGDTIVCKNDPVNVLLDFSVGGTEQGCTCTTDEASNFQWFRNGEAIPDATTSTYLVTDTGRYLVSCKFCILSSVSTNTVSVSYDNCSGIDSQVANQKYKLSLLPNPAVNEVIITPPSPITSVVKCFLYNSLGVSMDISPLLTFQNKWRFDIRSIKSGLYTVKIETNEGVFTGKFIKE